MMMLVSILAEAGVVIAGLLSAIVKNSAKAADHIDGLADRIDGLAGRIDGLADRIDGLAGRIDWPKGKSGPMAMFLAGGVEVLAGGVEVLAGGVEVLAGGVEVFAEFLDSCFKLNILLFNVILTLPSITILRLLNWQSEEYFLNCLSKIIGEDLSEDIICDAMEQLEYLTTRRSRVRLHIRVLNSVIRVWIQERIANVFEPKNQKQ